MRVIIKFSILVLSGIYICYELSAHYQNIVINGITLAEGSYECFKRYERIKHIAESYRRPFTVLDLGASEGYFSFELARNYGAICVMIEGNYVNNSQEVTADRLQELCKENTDLSTCMLLKKHITVGELARLSECEHFDVVLALNFVNHFGTHWQAALESIQALGDIIIVESPCADNKDSAAYAQLTAIHDYLIVHNAQILERVYYKYDPKVQASTLYVLKGMQKALTRFDWNRPVPDYLLGKITLESNDFTKTVAYHINNQIMRHDWLPGINLLTYKELNGVFPLDIKNLPEKYHEYKIQGTAVVRIPSVSQIYKSNPKEEK